MGYVDKYLKEGPTEVPERKITIPAYTTCNGCTYYRHEMMRSGRDPVYRDCCYHPEAEEKLSLYRGNIHRDYDDRLVTPEWCPYLKNKI